MACVFPTEEDTNDTVKFLRELEREWPGTEVAVVAACTDDPTEEPIVEAIHVFFPSVRQVLKVVAASIFLDATFSLTIYGYNIVEGV